jgi:hypothetical protein
MPLRRAPLVGKTGYSLEVKNTVGAPMRIVQVTGSGTTAAGKTVTFDATVSNEWVKSTTCNLFAGRKLPKGWAESCSVELKEEFTEMHFSLAGQARKKAGMHAVMATSTA